MQLISVIFFTLASIAAAENIPVGGKCSGSIQGLTCASNLDCIYPANSPPGASGVCTLKVSDVGGPCKQDFPNSAVCKDGLTCVLPTPTLPGASGTCMKQSTKNDHVPVGGSCGGGLGPDVAQTCDTNLDCVYPASAPPGTMGICSLKVSDVGGPCHQDFLNSAVCKDGLTCVLPQQSNPPVVGAAGVCQAGYATFTVATTGYQPPATATVTGRTPDIYSGAVGTNVAVAVVLGLIVLFF